MAITENKILVIKRPRITEKSSALSAVNCYTFDVVKSATKKDVMEAVKEIYKVTPKSVNIVQVPKKMVYRNKGKGSTGAGKKALVYLKAGDKIEFV